MAKLFDLVKVNTPTAGPGDLVFGAPFSPAFFTPAEVGASDGDTPRYVIVDGDNVELGVGLIKSSVTTMERTVLRSRIGGVAGTSKIALSGTAYIAFTAAAMDILTPGGNLGSLENFSAARTNLGAFGVVKQSVITSSGTHTFDPNMVYAILETQGGGGGGGGVQGAPGDARGGGGGAAGGWSQRLVTKAQAGASQPVSIGAAGVGQVGNTGTSGGATSIGTLCVANGGGPGILNNWSSGFGQGGSPGAAGTGDIAPRGEGGRSTDFGITPPGTVKAGEGGASRYGGGGYPGMVSVTTVTGPSATGFGAGGGGGAVVNAAASAAGGSGTPGLAIIIEFCAR